MDERTVCYDCGHRDDATASRCVCGEPLWFELRTPDADWPETSNGSMWRYEPFLPVSDPGGPAAAVGGTSLVRTPRLDEFGGCTVFVKDETGNPTGSFKDRGSAVAVAGAVERGIDWVGTVSHGNMAISTAAHAAAAGLECVTLVPADISAARLAGISQFDPTLLRVDGDFERVHYDTVSLEEDVEIVFANADSPLRVAGQKTVAFEICEAFAPEVPDAIVLPVGSGGNASAVWKGLRELRDAGLLDAMPRLYLIQAAASDPVARAYRDGDDRVTRVESGETLAYSIAGDDPPSGTRALTAARETGGAVASVTDTEMLTATDAFATDAGRCVEPASAVTLAGVRKLSNRGEIDGDDEVVCVATGTGFRELDHVSTSEPTTIDREDLTATLADLP